MTYFSVMLRDGLLCDEIILVMFFFFSHEIECISLFIS